MEATEKTRGLNIHLLGKKTKVWTKKIENIYPYPPFLKTPKKEVF
jgi:hypothetical protein